MQVGRLGGRLCVLEADAIRLSLLTERRTPA
jgi:hypothetical protein